jgi:anti-sigma-K factor RskA
MTRVMHYTPAGDEPSPRLLQGNLAATAVQVQSPARPASATPSPALAPARSGVRGRSWWLSPLVAAAAVVLLVVSNIFWMNRTQTIERQQQQLVALMGEQNAAFLLTLGDSAQFVALTPADTAPPQPFARIAWSPESDTALLAAANLPPLPADRTYQLWLIPGGADPVSAGLFSVSENGTGTLIVSLPEAFTAGDTLAITEEPAQGSPQPTSNPIIVGTV